MRLFGLDITKAKVVKVSTEQMLPSTMSAWSSETIGPTTWTWAQFAAAYTSWVYIAVDKIAKTVATLPLQLYVYRRGKSGKVISGAEVKREMKALADAGARHRWLKANSVERELVTDHPFLALMNHPNPIMPRCVLWQDTMMKMELGGACGWYMPANGLGQPGEIWPLPLTDSATLRAMPDPLKVIGGYEYRDGALFKQFTPEEILYLRYPSPKSPLVGQSPLAAQTYPYNIDSYLDQFQYYALANRAAIGMNLTTDHELAPDQLVAIREQIKNDYEGAKKAGKLFVTHSGFKVGGQITADLRNILVDAAGRGVRDKILASFDVPAGVVGLIDDVNRATMEVIAETFITQCVKPRIMLIEEYIEAFLLPRWDERLTCDFNLPQFSERTLDIQERGQNIASGYTTINEERLRNGLEEVPWGDAPWLPFGLAQPSDSGKQTEGAPQPTGAEGGGGATGEGLLPETVLNGAQVQALVDLCDRVLAGFPRDEAIALAMVAFGITRDVANSILPAQGVAPEPTPAPVVEPGKSHRTKARLLTAEYWTPERKAAHWNEYVKEHQRWERRLEGIAEKLFHAQRDAVLGKLKDYEPKVKAVLVMYSKAHRAEWVKARDATAQYNIDKSAERTRTEKAFTPAMTSLVDDFGTRRGRSLLGALGKAKDNATASFAFDSADPRVEKWLASRLEKFSKEITDVTFDKVHAILKEGFESGASVGELSQSLRDMFEDWDKYRAPLIARTETTAGSNFADLEAVHQAGLEDRLLKTWISSRDEATRDTHFAADMQYAAGIPLDEDFEVGDDTMEAPGCGSDAGENINCRCTMGYVEVEE